MRDLEAEMAKALEGHFFWEKSGQYENTGCQDAAEIRRIQRKFYVPKQPTPEEKLDAKRAELKHIVEAPSFRRSKTEEDIYEAINKLQRAVARVHHVDIEDISRVTTSKLACRAKSHFHWSSTRYFDGISIAEIGRITGKHHSTVINGIKAFKKIQHLYQAEIEVVDKIMGYKGPLGEVASQITCNDQSGV